MNETEWHDKMGEMVREYIKSSALEYYFSMKMTKARAAIDSIGGDSEALVRFHDRRM